MFISPMLLHQTDEPFDHKDYIFEPKADGFRLIYSYINGETKLYTRHGNEVTHRFPELHDSPFDKDIILDGELVVIDPQTGIVDFELCMTRFSSSTERTIQSSLVELPGVYVVFDILHYNGKDLRPLPLLERKRLLSDTIPKTNVFQPILYIEGTGTTLFDAIQNSPFREGIVAKAKNSKYVGKRSNNWLKIIDYKYCDKAVIRGFRKNEFGWLLSVEEKGYYRPAGIMELGTSKEVRKRVYQQANKLKSHEDDNVIYLRPGLSCKVKYRNLTRKGYFRSPVFVSWN